MGSCVPEEGGHLLQPLQFLCGQRAAACGFVTSATYTWVQMGGSPEWTANIQNPKEMYTWGPRLLLSCHL